MKLEIRKINEGNKMNNCKSLMKKYQGKRVRMLCDGWSDYGDNKDTQDFWTGDTGIIIGLDPMLEDYSYAWEIRFDSRSLQKHERLFMSTSTFWYEFEMLNEIHPADFLKEQK